MIISGRELWGSELWGSELWGSELWGSNLQINTKRKTNC